MSLLKIRLSAFMGAMMLSFSPAALADPDANINAMRDTLDVCGNSAADVRISQCETALAQVINLQPKLEYVDESMVSYFVEAIIRVELMDRYLEAKNITKHCEHAEKSWAAGHYAKTYSDHPLYENIADTVSSARQIVQTCRSIAGTPDWGAPL